MIGRRATVGLSLLCALVFCAFAAQTASAAKSTNTTAYTCVKNGGIRDFKDAHCDENVGPFNGEYGHEVIPEDTTTEIEFANTNNAVLKGKAFGAATEITCTTVGGTGVLHNVTSEVGKKHTITGSSKVQYTNCSVQKPLKCDVKEPIEFEAEAVGAEELGAEKNTMGLEFKPPGGGKIFVEITYINNGAEECAFKNKALAVEGTAVATGTPNPKENWSGATAVFTNEMTKETLTFGTVAAEFSNTVTVKMKPMSAEDKPNPIVLTTAT